MYNRALCSTILQIWRSVGRWALDGFRVLLAFGTPNADTESI